MTIKVRQRHVVISTIVLTAFVIVISLVTSRTSNAGTAEQGNAEPGMTLSDWPLSDELVFGRKVYEKNCLGCHGQDGAGDGPAAQFLDPLPRNFQKAAFKFRTTATGKLPLASDLVRTITYGLPGSSMPAFSLMPQLEKEAVAQYVLHIATFRPGKRDIEKIMKRKKLSLTEALENHVQDVQAKTWEKRVSGLQSVAFSPSPRVTPELLAIGKKRYAGECSHCHGDTGRGDGGSSYTLRDWKDEAIVARDFTTGIFRAGSSPQDVFMRMRTGLNGTPMPSIPGSDEEIWALAHYILSLKDPHAYVNRVHGARATGVNK